MFEGLERLLSQKSASRGASGRDRPKGLQGNDSKTALWSVSVDMARTVFVLAGNHNARVRETALALAGRLDLPEADRILMRRLGDFNARVRATAADALALRGHRAAVPRLLALFRTNAPEAAGPLGQLAGPADIIQIAELRGHVADALVATAFGTFLRRPDVSDRLRLDVINTLAMIDGPDATVALVEYLADAAESPRRPSVVAAQRILDQRGAFDGHIDRSSRV